MKTRFNIWLNGEEAVYLLTDASPEEIKRVLKEFKKTKKYKDDSYDESHLEDFIQSKLDVEIIPRESETINLFEEL